MDWKEFRAVEKIAAEAEPTWWERQKGYGRAMRQGDSGMGKFLADEKLVKERLHQGLSGALKGGLTGAGVGALAGLAANMVTGHGGLRVVKVPAVGSVIGGLLGTAVGNDLGVAKANREYLKGKGITMPLFGRSTFSEEAKKKYIYPYRTRISAEK